MRISFLAVNAIQVLPAVTLGLFSYLTKTC